MMKLIVNYGSYFVVGGIFLVIVYLLQKLLPLKFYQTVAWGFTHKKKFLTPVVIFTMLIGSVLAFASVNYYFLLTFGKARPVVSMGQSRETLYYYNLDDKEKGLLEHPLMPFSVSEAYLYPGQTFEEAILGLALIQSPGHEVDDILYTMPLVYIMVNLIAFIFLMTAVFSGHALMMYHAADAGIIRRVDRDTIFDNFKEKLGISILRFTGYLALFFIINAVILSLFSLRFSPMIKRAEEAAAEVRASVLEQIPPGTIIEGRVIAKDTIMTDEYATTMDRGKTSRRKNYYHFTVYQIMFNGLYDYPIYINRIYADKGKTDEGHKMAAGYELLLENGKPWPFKVEENYRINLVLETSDEAEPSDQNSEMPTTDSTDSTD